MVWFVIIFINITLHYDFCTRLNATVTRVTGEPLSKAATKVLLGSTAVWSLGSLRAAGAAWA